jgi:hypothetical protein
MRENLRGLRRHRLVEKRRSKGEVSMIEGQRGEKEVVIKEACDDED